MQAYVVFESCSLGAWNLAKTIEVFLEMAIAGGISLCVSRYVLPWSILDNHVPRTIRFKRKTVSLRDNVSHNILMVCIYVWSKVHCVIEPMPSVVRRLRWNRGSLSRLFVPHGTSDGREMECHMDKIESATVLLWLFVSFGTLLIDQWLNTKDNKQRQHKIYIGFAL